LQKDIDYALVLELSGDFQSGPAIFALGLSVNPLIQNQVSDLWRKEYDGLRLPSPTIIFVEKQLFCQMILNHSS
jgi:hypothetical protein